MPEKTKPNQTKIHWRFTRKNSIKAVSRVNILKSCFAFCLQFVYIILITCVNCSEFELTETIFIQINNHWL